MVLAAIFISAAGLALAVLGASFHVGRAIGVMGAELAHHSEVVSGLRDAVTRLDTRLRAVEVGARPPKRGNDGQ